MKPIAPINSLETNLKKKKKFYYTILPPFIKNYMDRATADLKNGGYEAKPLKVGDKLPKAKLINHGGDTVNVPEIFDGKPAIISFYRGTWCPYCNLELKQYDIVLKASGNENVQMYAISPEAPDVTMKKVDIDKLAFTVLSDSGNKFTKSLKLDFKLPTKLKIIYGLSLISLNKSQKNGDGVLPIPATYIVDAHGIITHAWIDADYTKRAEPTDVIKKYKEVLKG